MTLRRALLDLVALVAVLAFAACDCPPWFDVADPGVRMHGTPAEGADGILAAARARWPGLRGNVSWVERSDALAACGRDVAGCTWRRPECGDFAAYVVRIEPATSSALAHELCIAGGLPDDHSPGSDLLVCRDALHIEAERN